MSSQRHWARSILGRCALLPNPESRAARPSGRGDDAGALFLGRNRLYRGGDHQRWIRPPPQVRLQSLRCSLQSPVAADTMDHAGSSSFEMAGGRRSFQAEGVFAKAPRKGPIKLFFSTDKHIGNLDHPATAWPRPIPHREFAGECQNGTLLAVSSGKRTRDRGITHHLGTGSQIQFLV
jgi:hypothetical protein